MPCSADADREEFLQLVLSPEDQAAVAASTQEYIPLSPTELAAERAKLD